MKLSIFYLTVLTILSSCNVQTNTRTAKTTATVATTLPAGGGIAMVYVPGGTFTMGCTSEQGSDCEEEEKPAHSVTLNSYYIGKYEVTQKQWRGVMGTNPSHTVGCDNCPVENVNWDDIQVFIQKLNSKTGKTYRLPTEAEWEFAARGGKKSKGYKYAGSNNIDKVAWYGSGSYSTKHPVNPVGRKRPNELGIYDMSGNVWEWCNDRYEAYSASSQKDPKGASSGTSRVLRGGSWDSYEGSCRTSARGSLNPVYGNEDNGFRLVLVP